MRPSFEHSLRSPEHVDKRTDLKDEFEDGFDLDRLSEETRIKVKELQKLKRAHVERLHELLKNIDSGEEVVFPGRQTFPVSIGTEGGMQIQEGDKVYPVSEGQMLTDGIWGIGYALSGDISRALRKEYVLSETKRMVSHLLDKQILLVESELNQDPEQRASYQAVLKRTERNENILSWDDGHIAEGMVHSQVSKWIRDYGLPIEIIATDIYEDVTNKLDFVLKLPQHSRGVEVEAEDSEKNIGIQFTLQHRKDSMVGKRGTINRVLERGLRSEYQVDDIAIVNMHPTYIKRAVNAWKKRKLPGGPDEKLELAARVDLFEKMCKDLFSPEEIDSWRTRIFGDQSQDIKRLKTY